MILAILQARVSSSRLPGKVLKPILGKPMLELQLERVRRAKKIDKLVVATSVNDDDNAIEGICKRMGIECFRGSLNDVLDRFYQVTQKYQPKHIVRLTGDCPLTDPIVIDGIIAYHVSGKFDYTTNTLQPTFPHGLDAEVVRRDILETVWRETYLPSHREHVTFFVTQHPERFNIGHYRDAIDLTYLRWTVDEAEDFEVVKSVYEALYSVKSDFTTQNILDFLTKRQDLIVLNTKYKRNEGLRSSLLKDRQYLDKQK